MSVKAERLKADKITFFAACRENTGASLCDSGGAYGRWHELPEEDPNGPAIRLETCRDGTEIMASLSTPHFLNARYEIDRELQAKFDAWEAEHPDIIWFEAGREFLESQGFRAAGNSGNSYNGECDLTQTIQWKVWVPDGSNDGDEGLYAREGTRTVIHVHCGCDVGGGYGRPLFCKSKTDYAIPIDYMVGYNFSNGKRGRKKLTQEECQSFDERYQVGYSGNPSYELSEDLEKVWAVKGNQFKAKLKTGETFDVWAYFNEE